MGDAKLTVIVPTYGRQVEVTRAVRSVLDQDVASEIIIVDDGSPDPIRLSSEASNVRILRVEKNSGAAAARNVGVAESHTPWIAFLDSDDVWPAGSLKPRLGLAMEGGEAARIIWCGAFVDVWPGRRQRVRRPRASADPADFVSGCWSCPGSTALMSRATWDLSGGQDPMLRRLEDYEWLLRWGFRGGSLAVFNGIAAEISRGGRADAALVEQAAAYIMDKHRRVGTALRRRMQSYLALELAASRLHGGAPVSGALSLAHSWVLHPRAQASLEPFWSEECA